jgi:hypothetical protein
MEKLREKKGRKRKREEKQRSKKTEWAISH